MSSSVKKDVTPPPVYGSIGEASTSNAVELQDRHFEPPQQPRLQPADAPITMHSQPISLRNITNATALVDCPVCGERAMTQPEASRGTTSFAWSAFVCFCCCLGCIPYFMRSLKDVDHYCGRCNTRLARWHNNDRVEIFEPPNT